MLRFTCFAFLVTLSMGLELQTKLDKQWEEFKSVHNKKYSVEEEKKRKEIFKNNVQIIMDHNIKADLGEVSYTLGVNKYSDMDKDEFERIMCGAIKPPSYTSRNEITVSSERADIPVSLDWRDFNLVTSVRDQGSCGSCWTFSTTGAVEGAWAKSRKELISLSEQNLLDCTGPNTTYDNWGCDGGWPDVTMKYIIDNGGINSYNCYPYTGVEGTCSYNASCKNVQISQVVNLPVGNENALMIAVAEHGPVSVCLNAYGDAFHHYKSGLYKIKNCPTTSNHAVTIVGYGTENGQDYWLIKNSWGVSWGYSGYMKFARNNGNMCGIADAACYAVV